MQENLNHDDGVKEYGAMRNYYFICNFAYPVICACRYFKQLCTKPNRYYKYTVVLESPGDSRPLFNGLQPFDHDDQLRYKTFLPCAGSSAPDQQAARPHDSHSVKSD
ncbi:hypothetical protein P5673_026025 [Acropora cervicornis]|uniref:Uncharacterized protein n=1 Tax=Acropora cervicornis TaxID=6130 RepID=A0AAD9Q0T0_ACRCE|nr:hypothetical protein P5673_026025 [Acropora cervicornis]